MTIHTKKIIKLISTLLVLIVIVESKPTIDKDTMRAIKTYFSTYGYIKGFSETITPADIKVFQEYAYLPQTGELDDATIKKMADPRCGMADIKVKTNRKRRYVHQGTDWKQTFRTKGKMQLRWTLLNHGRAIRYEQAREVMRLAFFFWNEKTDIDFIEVDRNDVDKTEENKKENIEILVSFVDSYVNHGDPYPFDGEGRTLAHAFYPWTNIGLAGDVHFDDAEEFTYKSKQGKNLLWVATHEIGHSLGLEHSRNRAAVMYPWYTGYNPDMKLLDDDILGIQTLYGSRSKPAPVHPNAKPTLPPKNKGVCPTQGKITAVYYSDLYKQEFAFTDQHKIYFLGYDGKIPVVNRFNYYPNIAVPGTIEALFTLDGFKKFGYRHDKYQFIFNDKGKYFMYHGFSRSKNNPDGFSIHDGQGPLRLNFPIDGPNKVLNIDAVFNAVFNGRTYFFSGTQYWRYDNKNRRFDSGYPKNIKKYWGGLPSTVDAAYSSPDKSTTYFMAEGKFYLYDDVNIKVKSVHEISDFLRCGGGVSRISDSSARGNKGLVGLIGSIGDKPEEP